MSSVPEAKKVQKREQNNDQKMWGGRFERGPDASFYEFERSWKFDRRLLPQEIALDRAWARAITAAGILSDDECKQIIVALDEIERRAKTDAAWLDGSKAEDVHHFAETALIEKLGPLGAKLHTGRSRNEMVATEFRMFVKDAARDFELAIAALARAIAAQAEKNLRVPMPGTTHMQHAQPLLLSHWLLAHGEAFLRDADRIADAATRADLCPLGSGALAGCAFPLDRKALARDLGFAGITANSLDAVSDRDFALEFLFALTTLAMHLSRLAEDMVLFATPEFGFIELPDEFSTGSSLMPQKKNPDAWELIRGKTGRIYGALFALLTTCKGLPSSYQRDLQEDKEALFDSHDQALAMAQIAAATLAATNFNEERLRAAAQDPALVATEVADYLVAFGVPFREAHEVVGKVLRAAEQEGKSIREMPIERLKEFSPAFGRDLGTVLTLESALARRAVAGGTAPGAVRAALEEFKARLAKLEEAR
jgi:argininosuccinate lyase